MTETIERGSPLHWHGLGNVKARLAKTVRERALSSVASGVAVMAFSGAFWRNL